MRDRTIPEDPALYAYLQANSLRETDILRRLREETQALPRGSIQIAPEQGQFMALLVELMGARRAIEIGTFTGYSALVVAAALPAGGRLICCEHDEEWAAIARRYWQEAGLADRIELCLGEALDTLDRLLAEGHEGTFDFAFIDADKANYVAYFERCLALLRPGGLIVADNVLWGGAVADPAADDPDTRAIRAFNRRLHEDRRVTLSLVPIGDGLTLARKRG